MYNVYVVVNEKSLPCLFFVCEWIAMPRKGETEYEKTQSFRLSSAEQLQLALCARQIGAQKADVLRHLAKAFITAVEGGEPLIVGQMKIVSANSTPHKEHVENLMADVSSEDTREAIAEIFGTVLTQVLAQHGLTPVHPAATPHKMRPKS